jgi:hypothetical protein
MKKNQKKMCVKPLGAPHDPSGQSRTSCPRTDPYEPNQIDSVSEMSQPAKDPSAAPDLEISTARAPRTLF